MYTTIYCYVYYYILLCILLYTAMYTTIYCYVYYYILLCILLYTAMYTTIYILPYTTIYILPYTTIYILPYTGLHSIQIRKQIIKLFSPAYPHFQLRCIFRPVQRLSSFFRFKDRIPFGLRSRVVYKFKCQCCDVLYFGETIRHLHTRFSEHMGISACANKPLSKPSFSNILSHHQSSGHPIDPDDFLS